MLIQKKLLYGKKIPMLNDNIIRNVQFVITPGQVVAQSPDGEPTCSDEVQSLLGTGQLPDRQFSTPVDKTVAFELEAIGAGTNFQRNVRTVLVSLLAQVF